jgi:hypothetical protein
MDSLGQTEELMHLLRLDDAGEVHADQIVDKVSHGLLLSYSPGQRLVPSAVRSRLSAPRAPVTRKSRPARNPPPRADTGDGEWRAAPVPATRRRSQVIEVRPSSMGQQRGYHDDHWLVGRDDSVSRARLPGRDVGRAFRYFFTRTTRVRRRQREHWPCAISNHSNCCWRPSVTIVVGRSGSLAPEARHSTQV